MTDWSEFTVFDLAGGKRDLFNDGDWIESPHITQSGNRLLQTGNVGIGHLVDGGTKRYISDRSFQDLKCKEVLPGDILICRLAEPAGRACLVEDIGERRMLTSVDVTIYRPERSQADRRFVVAMMSTPAWFQAVSDRCGGSTRTRIARSELGKLTLRLPPVEEQARIADVLIAADELITALERMLAKKQAVKQGMMQQLLTGRVRLPGFSAKWTTTTLGDVTRIKTGSRNNQDKELAGRYPFFVRSATVERINTYSNDCEAILVPGEGGIGSIFHYVVGKFEVHQRVYKISDFAGEAQGRFIYYFMKQFFGPHAMEQTVKATVDSLRLPTFKTFPLRLPEVTEQRAVVAVLDTAEAETDLLQRRLAKARAIKQGMMQELLTGQTRLPIEEPVA